METYFPKYGITVTVHKSQSCSITSQLKECLSEPKYADAIESFLLAMASVGIDLRDQRFSRALDDCLESLENHSDGAYSIDNFHHGDCVFYLKNGNKEVGHTVGHFQSANKTYVIVKTVEGKTENIPIEDIQG